ncbi:MAG TPA: TraR/DksA C4-type zinc finger protein [Candidatus Limnocylindria bacterium]|nr:TraR/DksA C4-type zinc finger protein [Candidatus Limnocylindria bacterium]
MDTDYFRDLLLRTRDELNASIEPIRARLREPQRDSGGEIAVADQHPADAATDTEMRELDVTTEVLFAARLREVEDALVRLDAGTYGTCVACGKQIPAERLELVPETPYCVEDAAKQNG